MSDGLNDIREQVSARVQEEREHMPDQQTDDIEFNTDDTRFILQCLNNNERGDGVLYATKHRGKFVYVKSRDEKAKAWFVWTGHHWDIDKADFHHAAVEDIALLYQREAEKLVPQIVEATNELVEANDEVKECNKQIKKLQKDGTPEDIAACESKGIKADIAAGKASAVLKNLRSLQKKLNDRVDRLRGLRGAKNCIEWSHKLGQQGLFIYGDEVDQQPYLLPCRNCVVNLKTGDEVKANPDHYLVRYIDAEFKGIDEPAPLWEKFISEIHQDDQDLIEFIHRFFGYCLIGADPEQMYAFFIGEGANGKGIMFEMLREIFGDLSWSINPEMLMESKYAKSPDGPSPAVMSMQGRRLVVASETDEGRKIGEAALKRYTGGDTLTGRNLFDKYDTNFTPTHTLAIYSNHAPRGLTANFSMLRRLLYIEYPLRYVDDVDYWQQREPNNAHLFRKKDGDLKRKLRQEKNGIFSWLMRGCLKYLDPQNGGLCVPSSIRAAVEELQRKEDYVQQFIEKRCEHTTAHQCVKFGAIYDAFAQWYADEHGDGKKDDRFIPKKRKFGELLRKKGYTMPDSRTTSGNQYISGITFNGATYDDQYTWGGAETTGSGE